MDAYTRTVLLTAAIALPLMVLGCGNHDDTPASPVEHTETGERPWAEEHGDSWSGGQWGSTDPGPQQLLMGSDLVTEREGHDWYEHALVYSGPGAWCDDTRHLSPNTKHADYKTSVYSLRFNFNEADGGHTTYSTTVRINLPWDYDEDHSGATAGERHVLEQDIGVVLLVTGSMGSGVHCIEKHGRDTIQTDDDIAAVLAMGAVPRSSTYEQSTLGRQGDPMVTVTFNRPSRGATGTLPDGTEYDTRATSVADYQGYAIYNPGDDDGGPETTVLIEAVMQMALEITRETYDVASPDDKDIHVIVSSFSNGAAGAARWLRYTSVPVHAFIDAEGPSDSLEKTVSTECYDHFGQLPAHPDLPTSFDADAWANAATAKAYVATAATEHYGDQRAYRTKFGPSLTGLNLPPAVVAWEWAAHYGSAQWPDPTVYVHDWIGYPADIDGFEGKLYGSASQLGLQQAMIDGQFGHAYNSDEGPVQGYLQDVFDYWDERTLVDNLAYLPTDCYYVRINGKFDHVQPRHYLNRHAVRAVVAAQRSAAGVYLADSTYWDAMRTAGLEGTPPTDASTYDSLDYDDPSVIKDIWPDFEPDQYRNHVRVDLARWALTQE